MTIARDDIIATLWHGVDPFADRVPTMPPDRQGWNSDHPFLADAIDRQRPDVVVEVGVWKGASVLTMARRMREIACDGVVIAVDTWLGSAEHWLSPGAIPIMAGRSLLYDVFASNVLIDGLSGHVLPLSLDSASASEVLARLDIRPGVIHIDAAHDYQSVSIDLKRWWRLLKPGGTLIADDYDCPAWPTVTRAVDDFVARTPHDGFAAANKKCRFDKPAS